MTIFFASITLGVLLAQVLPSGLKPGVRYQAPTEEGFEKMLRARGLR